MFEYIKGKLMESGPDYAVVDVNGIGYRMQIPLSTFSKIPPCGKTVLFFTSFIVREESQKLFGFLSRDERAFFEKITAISGIGPKTSLAIIGHMDMHNLQTAITNANVMSLSKIPGIGKKTAERLILEMRDRVSKLAMPAKTSATQSALSTEEEDLYSDAHSALLGLGYNAIQAQKAVYKAMSNSDKPQNLAELIKAILKGI